MNKNVKETKETNNKKVKVKFPEVQSEGLLQIKEKVNKRKPKGFYSKKTNEELLKYVQEYCKENKITKRSELSIINKVLYEEMCKRKLLDSVFGTLKSKSTGFYSNMNDEEFLKYCKEYCDKNNLKRRSELQTKNVSLYQTMFKRNLLNSVFGPIKRKPNSFYYKMDDEELLKMCKEYCDKNNITKRSKLNKKNQSLYSVLRKRDLLDSVFDPLERKPNRFYSKKTDEELLNDCKEHCEKNPITKRSELSIINKGLYDEMRKRKLLDSVFGILEKKSHGFYSNMTDEELIDYGKKYCGDNAITKRLELKTKEYGLYQTMLKRKLLDSVFPEQSHLNDLVDAIRNFGDGENE